MYSNESGTAPSKNGKGVEVFTRNTWRKTGHCRRCDNGLPHIYRRRGAGGEKPSGVSLKSGAFRHQWEDEIAPGEKPGLRRRARARGREEVRRIIRDES